MNPEREERFDGIVEGGIGLREVCFERRKAGMVDSPGFLERERVEAVVHG